MAQPHKIDIAQQFVKQDSSDRPTSSKKTDNFYLQAPSQRHNPLHHRQLSSLVVSSSGDNLQHYQNPQIILNHTFSSRPIDVRMRRHPELQPFVPSDRDNGVSSTTTSVTLTRSRPQQANSGSNFSSKPNNFNGVRNKTNASSMNNSNDLKSPKCAKPKKCISMTRLDQLAQPKRVFSRVTNNTGNSNGNNLASIITTNTSASNVTKFNITNKNRASLPRKSAAMHSSPNPSLDTSTQSSLLSGLRGSTTNISSKAEEISNNHNQLQLQQNQQQPSSLSSTLSSSYRASPSNATSAPQSATTSITNTCNSISSAPIDAPSASSSSDVSTPSTTPSHTPSMTKSSTATSITTEQLLINDISNDLKVVSNDKESEKLAEISREEEELRLKTEAELKEAARRDEQERISRQLTLDSILSKFNISQ